MENTEIQEENPKKTQRKEKKLDDIQAQIEKEYGKSIASANASYILKLIEDRMKDGVLDDNIPTPSVNATAKMIMLIFNRPDIPYEKICEEKSIKTAVEYLFIRGLNNHYDEVHEYMKGFLTKKIPGLTPQMVLFFMNIVKDFVYRNQPSIFVKGMPHPALADRILFTLHEMLKNETGKGAALILECAYEEGLVGSISFSHVVTEFPWITKAAYNKYYGSKFTDKEKNYIKGILRTKIGYKKEQDGSIKWGCQEITKRGLFYSFIKFFWPKSKK